VADIHPTHVEIRETTENNKRELTCTHTLRCWKTQSRRPGKIY